MKNLGKTSTENPFLRAQAVLAVLERRCQERRAINEAKREASAADDAKPKPIPENGEFQPRQPPRLTLGTPGEDGGVNGGGNTPGPLCPLPVPTIASLQVLLEALKHCPIRLVKNVGVLLMLFTSAIEVAIDSTGQIPISSNSGDGGGGGDLQSVKHRGDLRQLEGQAEVSEMLALVRRTREAQAMASGGSGGGHCMRHSAAVPAKDVRARRRKTAKVGRKVRAWAKKHNGNESGMRSLLGRAGIINPADARFIRDLAEVFAGGDVSQVAQTLPEADCVYTFVINSLNAVIREFPTDPATGSVPDSAALRKRLEMDGREGNLCDGTVETRKVRPFEVHATPAASAGRVLSKFPCRRDAKGGREDRCKGSKNRAEKGVDPRVPRDKEGRGETLGATLQQPTSPPSSSWAGLTCGQATNSDLGDMVDTSTCNSKSAGGDVTGSIELSIQPNLESSAKTAAASSAETVVLGRAGTAAYCRESGDLMDDASGRGGIATSGGVHDVTPMNWRTSGVGKSDGGGGGLGLGGKGGFSPAGGRTPGRTFSKEKKRQEEEDEELRKFEAWFERSVRMGMLGRAS